MHLLILGGVVGDSIDKTLRSISAPSRGSRSSTSRDRDHDSRLVGGEDEGHLRSRGRIFPDLEVVAGGLCFLLLGGHGVGCCIVLFLVDLCSVEVVGFSGQELKGGDRPAFVNWEGAPRRV